MIIEDETKTPRCAIAIYFGSEPIITQDNDIIIIDKQQAAQLIAALQEWVNGEEIE